MCVWQSIIIRVHSRVHLMYSTGSGFFFLLRHTNDGSGNVQCITNNERKRRKRLFVYELTTDVPLLIVISIANKIITERPRKGDYRHSGIWWAKTMRYYLFPNQCRTPTRDEIISSVHVASIYSIIISIGYAYTVQCARPIESNSNKVCVCVSL